MSPKVTSQTEIAGEIQLQDAADFVPLAHVVGHDKQYRGQRCQRNVAGQRRGNKQNHQQRSRMNHACNRRPRAGADIRRRARNGAGGGNAAE